MRTVLLLGLCLAVVGCRARSGAQELSNDAFNESVAADFPPMPANLDSVNTIVEHPTGLVVGIRRIEFQPDHIRVNLRITNPSDKKLTLNKYRKMRLKDSQGNGYDLLAPERNKELDLFSGQTLDTTLSFKGGLAEQATSISLVTNDGPGGESNLTRQPKMVIGPFALTRPDDR